MIAPVPLSRMRAIEPLFRGVEETLIWSCLDGQMGRAWADNPETPRCAQVLTSCFCFLAGGAHSAAARLLVRNIPADYRWPSVLMTPPDPDWSALIEQVYAGRCKRQTRYAIKKEPEVFDRRRLLAFTAGLPGGYRVRPIDRELYEWSKTEPWAADYGSNFRDWPDYRRRGVGFVILCGDRPVAGASSFTVYNGGIEIEISTHPEFRRRGLATVCAARLILECLDRGLYPSWDAANMESVALAEKLGYHLSHPYPVHLITF